LCVPKTRFCDSGDEGRPAAHARLPNQYGVCLWGGRHAPGIGQRLRRFAGMIRIFGDALQIRMYGVTQHGEPDLRSAIMAAVSVG
jgi:hypothetical protein